MLFKNIAFGLASLAAVARAALISPDLVCPEGYAPAHFNPNTVVVVIATRVVIYPVLINTYIEQNTVINISGGINIIVNNAPTSISTTVTATVTETTASTVTATATGTTADTATVSYPVTVTASPTPPPLLGSFVLGISPPAVAPLRKRAISGLISGSGTIVDSCDLTAKFDLVDGELVSNGGYLSTNVGVPFVPFALSLNKGVISRTFTFLTVNNINDKLRWENSTFASGVALYCIGTDGVVLVVFNGIYPQGCVVIDLAVIPASECLGAISSTTVSSSTTSINTSSGTSTSVSTEASTSSSVSSTDTSSSTSTEASTSYSASTNTSLSSTSVPTTTTGGTSTTLTTTTTTTSPTTCPYYFVTFTISKAVPADSWIYVLGSLPVLGIWQESDAYSMSQDGYTPDHPFWTATIMVLSEAAERGFLSYRYILKTNGADPVWDDTNRAVAVPDVAVNCVLTLNDTWGSP